MFIAWFNEMAWQNPNNDPTQMSVAEKGDPYNVSVSNKWYDPQLGSQLYNRYLDERLAVEEAGFDGIMLNEHHSMPGCGSGVTNVIAAILARQTKKVKLAILGNLLPLWDDPLWLAEQLAMIDMISGGRMVTGIVRGSGRESISHNVNPVYNWDRWEEAHEFLLKTWTTPGPFRWEGKHYQYRYVNPWAVPLQKPHPPVWTPGTGSAATAEWAAQRKLPYMSFSSNLAQTAALFQTYRDAAKEVGYEAGPQYMGYNWKLHVDETDELAFETGRKYIQGSRNPFISGNEERSNQAAMVLPGLAPKGDRTLRRRGGVPTSLSAGRNTYEDQVAGEAITVGSPKTILPKIRRVLEMLRPGSVIVWDGEGAMTHDDTMRSMRLMQQEVMPAMREMAKELGLTGPFEHGPTPVGATTIIKNDYSNKQ